MSTIRMDAMPSINVMHRWLNYNYFTEVTNVIFTTTTCKLMQDLRPHVVEGFENQLINANTVVNARGLTMTVT